MFSGLTRLFTPQPFLDASPPPSPPRPLPLSWSFPTREGLWRFIGSSQQPGPESLKESHTDFLSQVSPGVRANNYYDNFRSYSRQNRLSGGAPANLRAEGEPANNLPSSRPRRKYKINREQNRWENLIQYLEAKSITFREQTRGDPTLAANTYTSPTSEPGPSVDNLTKNIYSQVGSLISAQVRKL